MALQYIGHAGHAARQRGQEQTLGMLELCKGLKEQLQKGGGKMSKPSTPSRPITKNNQSQICKKIVTAVVWWARAKTQVLPGIEPGLPEFPDVIRIRSANRYTIEP